MTPLRWALLLGAAGLGSVAVGAVFAASWTGTARPPDPACVDADALEDRVERAKNMLAVERRRSAQLRHEDEQMTGLPLPFPERLPALLDPPGLLDRLARALSPDAVEVLEVDCSEYPCLLTARWAGLATDPAPVVADVLRRAGFGNPSSKDTVRVSPTQRRSVYVVAMIAEDAALDPAQELRTRRRAAQHLSAIEPWLRP
jgi:hypothetical protein